MAAATAQTRLPNACETRAFDGMRTRTLRTNIAILRALLAGGVPGTPRLSGPVRQAMAERLVLFRRELALRNERDRLKLHEGSTAHARKRPRPTSPRTPHERTNAPASRGARALAR